MDIKKLKTYIKKAKYDRGWELLRPFMLNVRAEMAWDLVRTYGSVAGKPGPDNDSGRPTIALQSPTELVERCFEIADLFLDRADANGDIVMTPPDLLDKEE
jgi:hypothetical protein